MAFQFSRLTQVALAVCTVGLLAGCEHQTQDQSRNSVRPLRIPNPAALYCTKKGGTLSMQHDAAKGQVGYCHLPDGTVMDEWDLFRRDNPRPAK
ncbi:DUF333 domain-containing protein [Acetobacter persici]|uniref:putative hemolysin n=1 Tax=Acetobacter persici TaxID=1076596 RepID=UPI0039E85F22